MHVEAQVSWTTAGPRHVVLTWLERWCQSSQSVLRCIPCAPGWAIRFAPWQPRGGDVPALAARE